MTFGSNATVGGAMLGVGRRVTGLLVKADGSSTFTLGGFPNGNLDTRFGGHGVVRIASAGREIRITAMVCDSSERILLAGSGQPPEGMSCACRPAAASNTTFGNNGITYTLLGRPLGGDPIYTTFEAIDVNGPRVIIADSAAGSAQLIRDGRRGTVYTGRFADRLEIEVTRS